jgi:hypothetical protein
MALMHFSWAMDLDPKGANSQIKDALDPTLNRAAQEEGGGSNETVIGDNAAGGSTEGANVANNEQEMQTGKMSLEVDYDLITHLSFQMNSRT